MHTSLSKKLLAGLLSLVMVLSLVAPSMGTQAASKYSLTDKKSVKSGVTFKYQLKGVSKNQYVKITRNVSGETVKYNKKAVSKTTKINGTGKTLNLYVTYGEKEANYTGKFTVKVYGKKTNKCYKTLVEEVTVKVPEKEEPEPEEPEKNLEIVSAEQTHANTVKVVLNRELAEDDVVTLAKGTEDQKITFVANATDKKVVEITTADKIITATYAVKVTPKDTTKTAASKEFKGAVQELKGLKFGNELALAGSSNFYKAYAKLCGVDQFGDEYGVPAGKMTVYASTATASSAQKYDAATQTVTVSKKTDGSQLPFTVGVKVTRTAIYTSGSIVIQQSSELIVSNASYVAEMTFGELATTKAAFKDKQVTLERFFNGGYYLPVVAKDQYGNTMNAEKLQEAVDSSSLFITPDADQSVYAGFEKFETLDNGTVVMYVNSQVNAMPGKAVVNVSALGGYSTHVDFEIFDNPYIDVMTFEVPGSLYAGEKAELNVSGIDQYGEAVDLYEVFKNASATSITFADKNGVSKSSTTITATAGNFSVVKNSKKVKFYYTPSGAANDSVTFTVQTASNKVETQTITISAAGEVEKIKGFDNSKSKNIAPTNAKFDIMGALIFEDSNGNSINWKNPNFPAYDADAADASKKGKWCVYNADKTTKPTVTTGILDVNITKPTVTYYVGLQTDDAAGIDVWKQITLTIAQPDSITHDYKSYRAVVYNKSLLNSVAAVKDTATILVYGTDKNGTEVLLTSQKSDSSLTMGTECDYTITVSDGLAIKDGYVTSEGATGVASTIAANAAQAVKGTATITVWNASGEEVATTKLEYSNAPSVATEASWAAKTTVDAKHYYWWTPSDEVNETVNDATVEFDTDGVVTYTHDSTTMYLEIDDQYGNAMNTAVLTYNGLKATADSAKTIDLFQGGTGGAIGKAGKANTISINAGSIIKTITIVDLQ